jgi:hypothetical protein
MKFVQNRSCRPSMRRIAASQQQSHGGGGTSGSSGSVLYDGGADGTESVVSMGGISTATGVSSSSSMMVAGVSAMTFDQHSTLIRYY